eukprot:14386254-Alexandrium_andersonii.AAC.1
MSASLVGSEMCIRDSATAPPQPQITPVMSAEPRRSLCRVGRGRTPSTVSYTHLTLPTICSV